MCNFSVLLQNTLIALKICGKHTHSKQENVQVDIPRFVIEFSKREDALFFNQANVCDCGNACDGK